MDQELYSSEESDRMLLEMKIPQRRDMLLCIEEIFTALDTASPAVGQSEAARRLVQLIEEK